MEELLLVARAQQGDHTAFAQLVEQYQRPVYNLAYRMLGNAQDAEDAAQETFLRVYKQFKRYDRRQKFATWLLAIAAHYCIDRLRRRRFLWLSIEDEFIGETLASREVSVPEPSDDVLRRENADEIARMLERLSPTHRLVIVLKYWYDQSVEEIAQTTGDSISAVKVKLFRARQAMAKALEADRRQPAVVAAINGGC